MAVNPVYRSSAWAAVRRRVLARDEYRCQIRLPGCKGRADTVDHVLELEDGGAVRPIESSERRAVAATRRKGTGPCRSGRSERSDSGGASGDVVILDLTLGLAAVARSAGLAQSPLVVGLQVRRQIAGSVRPGPPGVAVVLRAGQAR